MSVRFGASLVLKVLFVSRCVLRFISDQVARLRLSPLSSFSLLHSILLLLSIFFCVCARFVLVMSVSLRTNERASERISADLDARPTNTHTHTRIQCPCPSVLVCLCACIYFFTRDQNKRPQRRHLSTSSPLLVCVGLQFFIVFFSLSLRLLSRSHCPAKVGR